MNKTLVRLGAKKLRKGWKWKVLNKKCRLCVYSYIKSKSRIFDRICEKENKRALCMMKPFLRKQKALSWFPAIFSNKR